MMRALIIEDEPKVSKELKNIILNLRPDISVLSTLESVEDTVAWLQHHEAPDIIFSDIQLSDGLSFDIFKKVTIHTPVIFCTAFDEYAIRAFETNGIDYLLKPIDENRLQQALDKYDTLKDAFSTEKTSYEKKLENLLSQFPGNYKTTLLIHFQEKIIPVKTADIAFIHYTNGVTSIYTHANQKFVLPSTLDELEGMLQPDQFFRANRQFIINRQAIVNIEHYFSRRLVVRLNISTPENIIISKVRSAELLQWIERS